MTISLYRHLGEGTVVVVLLMYVTVLEGGVDVEVASEVVVVVVVTKSVVEVTMVEVETVVTMIG